MEFPVDGSLVGSIRWCGARHVVVADTAGYLLACTDIPGKEGESLKLNAVFTGIKTGEGGVAAFSNLGDQIVVTNNKDRTARSFAALQQWTRVIRAEDLKGMADTPPAAQWADHDKQVQAIASSGDVMASCGRDGAVAMRASADDKGTKAPCVRVSSVWLGGCSAITVFRKDSATTVVACGGCDGSVTMLANNARALKGKGLGVAATTVAQHMADLLGEVVEALDDESTFVEKQLLADRDMEIALNAAKKNTFRDAIRKQKAALDEVLQLNAAAPEIEQIPREQIVVDRGMRDMIIADGDARVQRTKEGIIKDNKNKDLQVTLQQQSAVTLAPHLLHACAHARTHARARTLTHACSVLELDFACACACLRVCAVVRLVAARNR